MRAVTFEAEPWPDLQKVVLDPTWQTLHKQWVELSSQLIIQQET